MHLFFHSLNSKIGEGDKEFYKGEEKKKEEENSILTTELFKMSVL